MHEWGDSGITAVFFALFVAVLISLGVAQQARARAARYQEIRRLQSEAAQEAQREEAQAAAEYTSMVANRIFKCAFCSSPTTTRCARCKSARYCSEVCQIQHWKQGHRRECRPPSSDPPSSGSSVASSRSFSDVFSRSSSTSDSRTQSEFSDIQANEYTSHCELSRAPPSLKVNGTLLKPKRVLYPYDYFVKLFNYDRLRVPPCGLFNCGNSCFANVVLQCLTYTRPLTGYLLEGAHGKECRRTDWCFICELQEHVWRVRQDQNAFSPIRILSRIREIGNHLGYGRQEDAHEFMRFAIDSMQSICLDEAGGEKSVDPRSQETTLIHHIFGGHLQSQVQCMQCLHESNRYENMMDLAVEIHGSVETLEDALAQFTAPEWLDGDNKYKCDRCNAYVKARKRLTLHEAPNILTIALKRFQSGKFGKLNKRVTFPEVLDMMPYMSGKGDKPPSYLLYAVVVHVDMLNASFFGHYICYVKDWQGSWYKIDDSKVKEVDIEKVMSQRAYMLFYTRSSARPPPEMETEVAAVNTPIIGRPISEDIGVGNVYPEAVPVVTGMMPAVGGSMGLHAMVDQRQRGSFVEGVPQTVKAHAFVNGEHATTQPSSWERDNMCLRNDGEISVEESGCVAISASHLVTSSASPSRLSTEEPGIPRKIIVCNRSDSSNEGDTECISSDLLFPMSSDLADITLKVCTPDKPLTPNLGKRRLEDGLTPLPTPKPLDTDQLPAWPASTNGRSSPSSPVLHSAANQLSCASPNAPFPPRQEHLGDRSGEFIAPPASPVKHKSSGDQACLGASSESGYSPDRTDFLNVQSASATNEDLVGRAKRQHVEVDNSAFSLVERDQRSNGVAQSLEQPEMSELDRRDMEWNELVLQPGPPDSVATSGPVFDSCADYLPSDTNYCASSSEVQAFPSSLRQVLLDQQVKEGSTQRVHTDEHLSNSGIHPTSPTRAVEGTGLSCRNMQEFPTLSAMVFNATGGSALHDVRGDNCNAMKCEETFQGGQLGSRGELSSNLSDVSILPAPDWQRAVSSQTLVLDLQAKRSEGTPNMTAAPLCAGESGSSTHSSKDDGLQVHKVDIAGPSVTEHKSYISFEDKPAQAKLQKQKSTLKPIFAPGFLNRGSNPLQDSKSRQECTGNTATPNGVMQNGFFVKPTAGENGSPVRNNGWEKGTAGRPNDGENGLSGRPNGGENGITGRQNGVADGHSKVKHPKDGHSNVQAKIDLQVFCTNGGVNGNSSGFQPTSDSGVASSSSSRLTGSSSEATSLIGNDAVQNGEEGGNNRVRAETKLRSKVGSSSKGKRAATVQSANGSVPGRATDEQGVHTLQESRSSLSRPASGKQKQGQQKQGRNESCHCGSQRKWKKCCGKSEGIIPEISKRRLII